MDLRVGVIGATGFIGSAVVLSLSDSGFQIVALHAPRLASMAPESALRDFPPPKHYKVARSLAAALDGCEVVINAAGDSRATSRDEGALLAANAVLPSVIRDACDLAGVRRFIHISSAAVQGDVPSLDSSETYRPFSAYARSKALGEQWLLDAVDGYPEITIFRPPGVHAPGRAVTELIRRLSLRGLLPVAGDGSNPSPQASLSNVSDAVRFLAASPGGPPKIVHHPWEGLSCEGFLRSMGGKDPWHLPIPLAGLTVQLALLSEKIWPPFVIQRRRYQLLCFGQNVSTSWLSQEGWKPPLRDH